MPLTITTDAARDWRVQKIAVVGPGIVGMPMAALLADAEVRIGTSRPAPVLVVQRRSPTSGWKVDAINAGRSPIGGVEPALDDVVRRAVERGLLAATDDYGQLADADAILVCVQTDRAGDGPDYGPLFEALDGIARALARRPAGNVPLIVFESTLAPSSMATVVKDHFARCGLVEGRDVLLGNSPNRVMPGRLVERVRASDKLVAGLHPATPGLVAELYAHVVTGGALHQTNSLTAEIVKTLENAYRDVRIAYAAEVVRHCDAHDVDFYDVRRQVNERLEQTDAASADPTAVPSGGLLVPTVGVGGHCLPKDGILLCWRRLEREAQDAARRDESLFLEARRINDESPTQTVQLAERHFGDLAGRSVALLGVAYRFDSEDTRNSPTLPLATLLLERGCEVVMHDPYVKPDDQNLVRLGLERHFTRDVAAAVAGADYLFICTAHRVYVDDWAAIRRAAPRVVGVLDGCNLHQPGGVGDGVSYAGIGRGRQTPDADLVEAVFRGFQVVERGVANELADLIDLLNDEYAGDAHNRVDFGEVQRLAGTCTTGCVIVDPGPIEANAGRPRIESRLVERAFARQVAGGGSPTVRAPSAGDTPQAVSTTSVR